MNPVRVVILHRAAGPDDGPLTAALVRARERQADRHRATFLAAGASAVEVIAGPPDGRPFGTRLLDAAAGLDRDEGLVVLGSGAVPRLSVALARPFVTIAASDRPAAVANDRYSADCIGIARAREALAPLAAADPASLATDNALPRWLAEEAGVPVDVPAPAVRERLALDLDGPLDLVLLDGDRAGDLPASATATVRDRLAAVRAIARDRRAELVVAGRSSSRVLRRVERGTASRTRVIIEERGLRTARPGQRPPASVLGLLLDRDGPAALGTILARLGDAAVIDTRVLLAHRLGADERRWPAAEDRFASDLLLPDAVGDPWLRALTAAAREAPLPVLLGAHTLVGPGLPLALGLGRA